MKFSLGWGKKHALWGWMYLGVNIDDGAGISARGRRTEC